ncbi:MAG TPA: signal peptidase I [Pyrinomonadaceae bacterium]|nr:signal peptidase I [Pyrinomonadaceae bacterium]
MASKKIVALIILVAVLVAGAAAFIFARIFLIRLSVVPSGAMKNTIIPGDHVLSFKLFGKPERGSVVLFQYPQGRNGEPETDTYYIARVVGLPGETIQLRDNTVYINERPLDEIKVLAIEDNELGPLKVTSTEGKGPYQVFYMEDFAAPPEDLPTLGTNTPFRIPANYYFVLGDNRDNSQDSRYRGPVPANLIWGRASYIYLSVSDTQEIRTGRTFKRVE